MKFQRKQKIEVGMDLTSLIDVVFILLLFFILTTTFVRDSTLHINLPAANGEEAGETELPLEIVVTSAGDYRVNGQQLVNSDIDTLMRAISESAAGNTEAPITIVADAATTHQSVVTAMDAVARLGFSRLNIATRQAEASAQ
jgi:biopolymer transport protein ExbD